MKEKKELQNTAKEFIEKSEKICALTGAGISAESGIPTFRGKDGLWNKYDPTELATPQAFQRDPKLVWEWYNWRREKIASVYPNSGHLALKKLEDLRGKDFVIITQNVDGLHNRVGNKNVLEIHGNIWKVKCTECGGEDFNYEVPLKEIPPRCPRCGGLLRPGVVWFGESLPYDVMAEVEEWLRKCNAMLVIGTSGVVQPAASFAFVAKHNDAKVIEINLEPTPISEIADVSIFGKAGEILPEIIDQIQD